MDGITLIDPSVHHEYKVGASVIYYGRPLNDARWRLGAEVAAAASPAERSLVFNRGLVVNAIRGWSAVHDPTGRIPADHEPRTPPDPAIVLDLVQRLGPHVEALAEAIVELGKAAEDVLGNSEPGSHSGTTPPA